MSVEKKESGQWPVVSGQFLVLSVKFSILIIEKWKWKWKWKQKQQRMNKKCEGRKKTGTTIGDKDHCH